MAIVNLDKLTVDGTSAQKADALDGLQQLGCLHLVNLQGAPPKQREFVSQEAREALRFLQTCSMQRHETVLRSQYDRERLIDEALTAKQRGEELRAERDELRKAVADLEPWGDFSLPQIEQADDLQFWFYKIPLHRLSQLPADAVWYIANKDNRFAYVVLLASDRPQELPFDPVELDRQPLSQLSNRLEGIEEELEALHWKRVTLTCWRPLLQNDLDAADDKAARATAADQVLDDQAVFAVQGWVPRQATADVMRFADQLQLAITIEPARPEDRPPTLLANPERVAGAEGCVTFYITPAYHAWDPTTIVFFSFSLFFAMIVSDAGYGLTMAGLLLFLWGMLGRSRSGMRLRGLLVGVVSATIIYGVIAGSYFGLEPPPSSWLDMLRVKLDGQPVVRDQTAMMVIAVAIGVAHLSLANIISAWQSRKSLRCLGHVGWALMMLGAFLLASSSLSDLPIFGEVGKPMLMAGVAAVLLFSSERSVATLRLKTHFLRLVDGVLQFANVPKAFGDSLSYLRLFALGLASAQLAVTFNGLAADASSAGGIGVLLALLILAVGHSINFLLGIMGGVVHGLRLNCIEFFNWSLTEEGFSFQPFRKKVTT